MAIANDKKLAENMQIGDLDKTVMGLEIVSDIKFKKTMLLYLSADEKLDYEKMYRYLSKDYLEKHFPGIKNAKDYSELMKNKSESSKAKYLEITSCKQINRDQYEVGLIFETHGEGVKMKIKTIYYFLNENGNWKYNGMDVTNYKTVQ